MKVAAMDFEPVNDFVAGLCLNLVTVFAINQFNVMSKDLALRVGERVPEDKDRVQAAAQHDQIALLFFGFVGPSK